VGAVALIVEADENLFLSLTAALEERGLRARRVLTEDEAARSVRESPIDVVVIDPGTSDAAALAALVARFPDVPVIIASDSDVVGGPAVLAGAAEFLPKPLSGATLASAIERVLGIDEIAGGARADVQAGLLGASKSMAQVLELVRRVAVGNATVLIRGESGTGKELVARAIHEKSARAGRPFVKVHCAGIPEALLESELFGYERGAFTGAVNRKPGRLEIAEGGTLFLDEIGDVSAAVQVKLLRLLQDRQYERLGSNATLTADVRFVAATHRDLEHRIKQGEFREDLFYRLNVVPVWLPPLRARRDDVPLLATHFCATFARAHEKPATKLSPGAVDALSRERWPGNVRQLQNFVERLVVLCESGTIEASDVTRELAPPPTFGTDQAPGGRVPTPTIGTLSGEPIAPLDSVMRDAERSAIERALRHAKGNRAVAARLLGIGRATLYKKLIEHGIGE
jgi:two-component system response regulator AtoC